MMRSVTASEWRDFAGGVGCPCDHHDSDVCWCARADGPCVCSCHYRPDLRLVAPKEMHMSKNPFQESSRTSRKCLSAPDIGTRWSFNKEDPGDDKGVVVGLKHVRENGDVLITVRFGSGREVTYSYDNRWVPADVDPIPDGPGETRQWKGMTVPAVGSWWFDMATRFVGPVKECKEAENGKDLRIVFYPMEDELGRGCAGEKRPQVVLFLKEWRARFVLESSRKAPPRPPPSPATNDTGPAGPTSPATGGSDASPKAVKGVVRRADGSEAARVAVYIDPTDQKRLKMWCVQHGREMSEVLAPAVSRRIQSLTEEVRALPLDDDSDTSSWLLKLKVRKATRRAIKRAAAARGMSMKRYLLGLVAADGIVISAVDLKAQHDDEDEEQLPLPEPVAAPPVAQVPQPPTSGNRAAFQRKGGRVSRHKTFQLDPELATSVELHAARAQRDQSDIAAEALADWLKKAVGG